MEAAQPIKECRFEDEESEHDRRAGTESMDSRKATPGDQARKRNVGGVGSGLLFADEAD